MLRLTRCLLFVSMMAWLPVALAAVYHVAPDGSDGNSGAEGDPWLTLQHAADTVQPGDRVMVHAGTYTGFDLRTTGNAGDWIEFLAETGVVIDAPNAVTGDGINLEGVSYVAVEGFTVQGTSPGLIRNGLRAVGAAGAPQQHITFRDNQAFDNQERGIFTGFVHDLFIEGNETSGSVDEHGIYVSNSSARPTIRGNHVHDNNAAGIHMNGDISLGGDGLIRNAQVENNVIVNNGGGGAGVNGDGLVDSLIRNNLIIGNHATGIALYRIDGGAPSTGNRVINNTVVNDDDGRWGITISDASTDNTLRNNIFLSRHGFRGAMDIRSDSLSGLESDHNVVEDVITTDGGDSTMTLAEWQSLTGEDGNSFIADEASLFVDPVLPDGDYHLQAGSPAVDAGTGQGTPAVDFEFQPRPQGAAPDIGADERSE